MSNSSRRDLPPLTALRAFEATARLGSLSLAADELCVTHGAVSRHIRALEDWAGAPFFDRVGKKLKLTEAGRRYRDAVSSAFDDIALATQRFREETREKRLLIVNALPTFTMRWLLPRLTSFQQREPVIELKLVTSDEPVSRLAPGTFDIAIRREAQPWPGGFVAGAFLEEREIPVASPALLEKSPIHSASDLAHHTLLNADTRPGAWKRWLEAAGAPEAERQATHQQFDHFYLALQAASDGLGVALGPLPILAEDLRAGRLIAPLTEPSLPSRAYCWLAHEAQRRDPAIAAFCNWLEEEGRKHA